MKLLALLRCLKYCRIENHGFHIRPSRNYTIPYSPRRFASSLTSRKLPTSIHYKQDPNYLTPEQGNLDLVKLVEEGSYGDANRLRLQLIDNGIKIQRHPSFEKAAISALQWHDPAKCLEEFSTWFSLVPNADEALPLSRLNPFRNIRYALFYSGVPSEKLSVILQFGIMCAYKGYTGSIHRDIFQYVTRFDTPQRCCTYMLKIEKAATQYEADRNSIKATIVAQKYRALAVEICTQLNWLRLASKVAQQKRHFPLPEQTIRFLLERVKSVKQPFAKVLVSKLREELDFPIRRINGSFLNGPNLVDYHPASQRDYAVSLDPWRTNVARPLKAFNAPFYEPANTMKFQTLLFSNSHRNYHQVLDIFSANFVKFDLGGVFDHTLSRILATIPNAELEPKAPTPIPFPEDHYWIIFNSIVRLATSLPWPLATLESLYESFLCRRYIRGMKKVFGSFISAFGRCGDLDQARMVVHDLRQLGIMPDFRHLGRLAGAYARAGKVDKAMDILDELERPGLRNGKLGMRFSPRYATYGRTLEGFVEAGMLEHALAVEARLMKILPYTRGLNLELDRVLDALRALQVDEQRAKESKKRHE